MQVIPVLGGRYRLGPEIGSGGMGAVHRAWDERFSREVAIKVLRAGSDSVERERLRREAQYLARLDHENLVAVLDAGSDRLRSRETVWFAMELVEGPDLRTVVRQDGPLAGPAVRRVLAGLLAALGALHAAGVVHRDLKPANVLLTAEPASGRWDVKLVDLGIAQHVRTDHLTSTGQVVGTAAYLSPEQVNGSPIGPASDVYALGLVAIEALTGRIAFPGAPAESAVARLVRGPELPPELDPSWRAVLSAMTAMDPANRPTVQQLREAVRHLPDELRPQGAAATPTELLTLVQPLPDATATALLPREEEHLVRPRSGRHPRRHLLVAAFLLLVVTAAGGWIAALTGGASPPADAATTHSSPPPTRAAPAPTATVAKAAAVPAVAPTPQVTEDSIRKAYEQAQATRKAWRDRIKQELKDHHGHR